MKEDAKTQALYRACREESPGFHPLKVILPALGSPSVLGRIQERLDVEGNLRQLKEAAIEGTRERSIHLTTGKGHFTGS